MRYQCKICNEIIKSEDARDHLECHNPNARGMPLTEVVRQFNVFMTTEEAFDIVYDLALENAFDPEKVDECLIDEAERQQLALKVAHGFIMNNIID